ncbi:MAG: bifunctional nuclease domain-containing protein [Candidatus Binatia bacterium]
MQRVLFLLGLAWVAGCSAPTSSEVEVEVSRVAIDPASRSPVVLLEDKAHTVALPIWIGPAEAHAIATRLEGVDTPRPLTHDLMKNVFDRIGVGLRKVVIGELRDSTYFARVVLLWDGEEVEIDSRPSDAIALAMRFEQPIYVSRALLESDAAFDLRGVRAGSESIGGVTVQALSDEMAKYFDVPAGRGVVVSNVARPAAADLRRGDVILEVDGAPVRAPADYRSKVADSPGGVDLSVQRDGERIHVAVPPATGAQAD